MCPTGLVTQHLDHGVGLVHLREQPPVTRLALAQRLLGEVTLRHVLADLLVPAHGAGRVAQRHDEAVDEDPAAVLAPVPAHIGRRPVRPCRRDLLLRHARPTVLRREQHGGRLADRFRRRPAEHRLRARQPVGDAVVGVGLQDGVVAGRLHDGAEPLLGRVERLQRQQAVDDRPEEGRVGAQELAVVVVEGARHGRIDLQQAEGAAPRKEDRDVGDRLDTGVPDERREVEPVLAGDVLGDDRRARRDRVGLGGVLVHRQAHVPDHALVPAHARADEQGAPPGLDLEHLGAAGPESLGDQAAGLGEHRVEVVRPQRELAEVGQDRLSPVDSPGAGHLHLLRVAHPESRPSIARCLGQRCCLQPAPRATEGERRRA